MSCFCYDDRYITFGKRTKFLFTGAKEWLKNIHLCKLSLRFLHLGPFYLQEAFWDTFQLWFEVIPSILHDKFCFCLFLWWWCCLVLEPIHSRYLRELEWKDTNAREQEFKILCLSLMIHVFFSSDCYALQMILYVTHFDFQTWI